MVGTNLALRIALNLELLDPFIRFSPFQVQLLVLDVFWPKFAVRLEGGDTTYAHIARMPFKFVAPLLKVSELPMSKLVQPVK